MYGKIIKCKIDGIDKELYLAATNQVANQYNELGINNGQKVPVKAHTFRFTLKTGMKFFTSGQHYEIL